MCIAHLVKLTGERGQAAMKQWRASEGLGEHR
jgi:hypothetical protein